MNYLVNTRFDFVGPMVPHFTKVPAGWATMTGGFPEGCYHAEILRDESFDFGALDAPDLLPLGACQLVTFHRFSITTQSVQRPGWRW